MSDEKDLEKDKETTEDLEEDESGCDCSHCPGCGAPEKPDTEEKE